MDPEARQARARLAALLRYRCADDPQVVQARTAYATHQTRVTRARVQRLTPEERSRLLAALTADDPETEPANT